MPRAKRPARPPLTPPGEPRNITLLTSLWMLSLLTALACESVAGAAQFYLRQADAEALPVMALAGMMTLASLVTATLTLALTAAVCKLRPVRPPLVLVVVAILAGIMPWLAMLILRFAG
ncbi:MAG: hypothetical protein JSS27_08745 [Planctomycetes bacterium]|nr:hypothetical protein [Planctomycetota bacterium]